MVINKITEYSRSVEVPLVVDGELARFTVLTSPGITVGPGDPANPIENMSDDDIAMMVQEQYDTIDNVERLDEREADLLGETTTVTRYRADAETEGQSTDVNLHIARGRSERSDDNPDFVVTVGIHPSTSTRATTSTPWSPASSIRSSYAASGSSSTPISEARRARNRAGTRPTTAAAR